MTPAHALGCAAEDLVHRHLQAEGWQVVDRNWRMKNGLGEIDLVAWDGSQLVFVEVKARSSTEFGLPEWNVDDVKRVALAGAARQYARSAGLEFSECRMDLFSVVMGDPPELKHVRGSMRLRARSALDAVS
jgi:putative endonuclease